MNKVNFFGIDRYYKENKDEINFLMNDVFDSGQVIGGQYQKKLELHLASLSNRKYAVIVGSCTDALFFSLKAAGIKDNDEVIVTSYSFIASANAILRVGAKPIFVDIDPETYLMSLDDLSSKITSKTKAILAVHMFGLPLDIDALEKLARVNELILIEDAAQALGASNKKRVVGSMGLASCVSFDPTKIIGAFGNGGVVLTDDFDLANKICAYRYHGKNFETNRIDQLGYNSRISTFQSALLLLQLRQLQANILRRNEIARIYREELSSCQEINFQVCPNDLKHIYHKFVINIPQRDSLKKYLSSVGIESKIHYSRLLFDEPLFTNYRPEKADSFVGYNLIRSSLSLPIYPELNDYEVLRVCNEVKHFFKI